MGETYIVNEGPFMRTEKGPDFIFGHFLQIKMLVITWDNFQFWNDQPPQVLCDHTVQTLQQKSFENYSYMLRWSYPWVKNIIVTLKNI